MVSKIARDIKSRPSRIEQLGVIIFTKIRKTFNNIIKDIEKYI